MSNPIQIIQSPTSKAYELSSLDWLAAKYFGDYYEKSRKSALLHKVSRQDRFELIKAHFECEQQKEQEYIHYLDEVIASYDKQMDVARLEMLSEWRVVQS